MIISARQNAVAVGPSPNLERAIPVATGPTTIKNLAIMPKVVHGLPAKVLKACVALKQTQVIL